jgi:tripartite-type tricarboxylate transporter receptor subunit TctC
MTMKKLVLQMLCVLAAALPTFGVAQNYPDRPIKLISPWPAGGSADAVGRIVAAALSAELGASVVVENVPGASGAIGTSQVVRALPDGYTLLLASSSGNVAGPQLTKKASFDMVKDFKPVGMIGAVNSFLVVGANAPYKTPKDIVDAARKAPGKLSYGSGGNGNSGHLTAELFKSIAKFTALHIPYRGNNPALTDLMGGQLDFMFDNGAIPLIKGGKVKALAVASETRIQAMPEIPTFAELGFSGVHLSTWFGLAAPAGTSNEIANKLNAALVRAINQPETRRRLIDMGAEPKTSTPEQFAVFWVSEVKRYKDLIMVSGASID